MWAIEGKDLEKQERTFKILSSLSCVVTLPMGLGEVALLVLRSCNVGVLAGADADADEDAVAVVVGRSELYKEDMEGGSPGVGLLVAMPTMGPLLFIHLAAGEEGTYIST